jgi:hypothetical protein
MYLKYRGFIFTLKNKKDFKSITYLYNLRNKKNNTLNSKLREGRK